MKRTLPLLLCVLLMTAGVTLGASSKTTKKGGYRVRYFTYQVIAIDGNDITLRSRSGKKTLVVHKDPRKFNLHVGDYVRYNSRYNRIRKRSAAKERAYEERRAKEQERFNNGR